MDKDNRAGGAVRSGPCRTCAAQRYGGTLPPVRPLCSPGVLTILNRMVEKPGIAEEVTEDVFVALWHLGASYRSHRGPFSTCILSVTHNRCVGELSKRRRQTCVLGGFPKGRELPVKKTEWSCKTYTNAYKTYLKSRDRKGGYRGHS